MNSFKNPTTFILLLILLLALSVRLLGINYGLPYVLYPDEAVIVNHAMAFGTGDLNPHYFIYPSLYMYVLFIVYGMTYIGGRLLGAFGSTDDFIRLFFTDATIFYLPGRLIAAFGSDRDRYHSAEEVQCYSGIAPVTRRSGKTLHVSSRYACPKFLKQTFHEFADHARKWSRWSAAYYRQKREAGCKHQAAVRALAFKWIRIMFRLWKTHSTYDETRYIQQLKQTNSPLVKYLETA